MLRAFVFWAVGCWLLAVGCWVLGFGFWVLAVSCWVLGFGLIARSPGPNCGAESPRRYVAAAFLISLEEISG